MSRFFITFWLPHPLSQVVTLLTTPSENYVTLFQPQKHEKMYESESDSFHSQYCYTELILRISYSSVHGDDSWLSEERKLLNTCSK